MMKLAGMNGAFDIARLLAFFGLGEEPRPSSWGAARAGRRGRVYGGGSRAYDGPRPVRIDHRPKRLKPSRLFRTALGGVTQGLTVSVPYAVRAPRPAITADALKAWREDARKRAQHAA